MGKRSKAKPPTSKLAKPGPKEVLPPKTLRPSPQAKILALVINGNELQSHILEQVKMTLAQGVPVILYAYAPKYSQSMKPLCFGEALGLVPNEHGQVSLAVYKHYSDEEEVDFEILGLVHKDFDAEVGAAWTEVYYKVWTQDDQADTEAETEAESD